MCLLISLVEKKILKAITKGFLDKIIVENLIYFSILNILYKLEIYYYE